MENSDAIAADTSSPAAATTAVVDGAAAAFAAVSPEPMPARSDAAEATNPGNRHEIRHRYSATPSTHRYRDLCESSMRVRGFQPSIPRFALHVSKSVLGRGFCGAGRGATASK